MGAALAKDLPGWIGAALAARLYERQRLGTLRQLPVVGEPTYMYGV